MNSLLPIMAGGAIGAALRHLLGGWMLSRLGPGFPFGTLGVNLAGGLLMGLLAGLLARSGGGETLRLFLGVGVLGGFTTFSAFSLETWLLFERGEAAMALVYIGASVAGSVLALGAGLMFVRALP
jgi:CrcB protein